VCKKRPVLRLPVTVHVPPSVCDGACEILLLITRWRCPSASGITCVTRNSKTTKNAVQRKVVMMVVVFCFIILGYSFFTWLQPSFPSVSMSYIRLAVFGRIFEQKAAKKTKVVALFLSSRRRWPTVRSWTRPGRCPWCSSR
jgi:hypothetical protein